MTLLEVKILLSCVFLIYTNVEAARSPKVRQVQKLFIILWNSMIKRQIAETERSGFDSSLEVIFFLRPSLLRNKYSYIFSLTIQLLFYHLSLITYVLHSLHWEDINYWFQALLSVSTILSQTVFAICHNQVLHLFQK